MFYENTFDQKFITLNCLLLILAKINVGMCKIIFEIILSFDEL